MNAYRLYFVGADGHFKGVEVIEADDDDAAILAARKHAGPFAMELWNLDKKVRTFPPARPGLPIPL